MPSINMRASILAVWIVSLSAGVVPVTPAAERAIASNVQFSFKLDPRLTQSLYMGEHWVSPPAYTTTIQTGKEVTVEVRARVLDAAGKPTTIRPEWIPENPGMVAVSPSQGQQVRITVRGAGESKLKVSAPGFSRELYIKARQDHGALQVDILQ